MPERNRVTPYGEIIATSLRGRWMGNRGCIHRDHAIVRPWQSRRWIICALEYKDWIAPKWEPGRWTALFFSDEAVAFAAGHRPCALCRRPAYRAYRDALAVGGAEAIDARLDAQRRDGRRKRLHRVAWRDLPAGTFVDVAGVPHVVLEDRLCAWSTASGYGAERVRSVRGDADALTPQASIDVLRAGYALQIGC